MLDQLSFHGKLHGKYKNANFEVEVHHQTIKILFPDTKIIKELKDLFTHFQAKEKPKEKEGKSGFDLAQLKTIAKHLDIEIYLEGALVARIGKKAQKNMFGDALGVDCLEIFPGQLISHLFDFL